MIKKHSICFMGFLDFLTAESKRAVADAQRNLTALESKPMNTGRLERAMQLRAVIRRDTRQKAMAVIGGTVIVIGAAVSLLNRTSNNVEGVSAENDATVVSQKNNTDISDAISGADPFLVQKSKIRISVQSSPAEKERMRALIRSTLGIVLSDPVLAEAYDQSSEIEQIVVPDLLEALREAERMMPEALQGIGQEVNANHGDAYTIGIEDREPNSTRVLDHKSFMLLRKTLLEPGNEHSLLMTLDHEVRHIAFRGKGLLRRDEEEQVYTQGIARMRRVGMRLQAGGKEDADLGDRIMNIAIPKHQARLRSWNRMKRQE